MLVELGLVEHRYATVKDVLDNGASITDVARRNGVSRSAVHEWLTKYAAHGLAGLVDKSSKPNGVNGGALLTPLRRSTLDPRSVGSVTRRRR